MILFGISSRRLVPSNSRPASTSHMLLWPLLTEGLRVAKAGIAREKGRSQEPNAQIAKSRDIPVRTALPKGEERSIKLQIGGNRNRRPNPKSQRRKLQMRLPQAHQKEKTMHMSRLAPQILFPSMMKTLPLSSLSPGITMKLMVYLHQPTLLSIVASVATSLLTNLSLSILRQSRPNLFEPPMDIPFLQSDVEISSLLFL